MKRRTFWAVTMMTILAAGGLHLQAQDGPPDRGNDGERRERAERGERGGRDRGDFRARMAERMREQLGVTAEEWSVLEPKINAVSEAQRDLRGGFGWGFPGQGQRGQQADNPVAQATQALRETLAEENAPAEDIAQKLEALREAREKAQADLEQARADLRELVTQRQEAALVLLGILE